MKECNSCPDKMLGNSMPCRTGVHKVLDNVDNVAVRKRFVEILENSTLGFKHEEILGKCGIFAIIPGYNGGILTDL